MFFDSILRYMEGITVLEIAQKLGISSDAARKRLNRLGVEPLRYIGSAAIYREAALEAIKDRGARGRPKAGEKTKTAPKTKPKKTAKKT
jgi:predicted ArsR family transcriptional regulator